MYNNFKEQLKTLDEFLPIQSTFVEMYDEKLKKQLGSMQDIPVIVNEVETEDDLVYNPDIILN